MPGTPPADEEIDRLLASLDPLDRSILFVEGVESARDALGEAIVREARRRARTRARVGGPASGPERRPRSLRRARRRRLALLAASEIEVSGQNNPGNICIAHTYEWR